MADETPCYIGRKPECRCVVAAVVDEPGMEKSTGRDVARFIANGLSIERVTVEEARTLLHPCSHKPTKGGSDEHRRAATRQAVHHQQARFKE